MAPWTRSLLVGLGLIVAGIVTESRGQAPSPAPADTPVYTVTYVEVMPTATAEALALLKRYREATRKEEGNRRCEVVQRIGQPHQFVILEAWREPKAFEAHGAGASNTGLREKIAAIRNAPTDERVHTALSVGPLESTTPPGPAYVVTHVDVIPPRKDDGVAALRQLGDDSRGSSGNQRFEVVQQISRPNHFSVIEVWNGAKAVEAHSAAPATRRFRDRLAPITGALYDERMYTLID
jgi:quinol monooxygenase YgiN